MFSQGYLHFSGVAVVGGVSSREIKFFREYELRQHRKYQYDDQLEQIGHLKNEIQIWFSHLSNCQMTIILTRHHHQNEQK